MASIKPKRKVVFKGDVVFTTLAFSNHSPFEIDINLKSVGKPDEFNVLLNNYLSSKVYVTIEVETDAESMPITLE